MSPGWIFQFSCLNELEVFLKQITIKIILKSTILLVAQNSRLHKSQNPLPGGLQSRFSSNLIKSDSSNIPNRDISLLFLFSSRLHILHSTMLQKLSKCEVKVHNIRIYLPLNFSWNEFWQNLDIKKLPILQFQRLSTLNFGKFGLEKWLKFTKIKIQNL